jgi:dihydrofolate reductase/thymidylate synthase
MLNCSLPRFSIIVAVDENAGIGISSNNDLPGSIPWNNRTDKAWFAKITKGTKNNAVIMGRKTYESIPIKFRPLPERQNVIISSQNVDNISVKDFSEALLKCKTCDTIFVIGGQQIYELALYSYGYLCDTVIISQIEGDYNCDIKFPLDFVIKKSNDPTVQTFQMPNPTGNDKDLVIKTYTPSIGHQETQYLDLLQKILENGKERPDRTDTGVISLFGQHMTFNLTNELPLITTKKMWQKGIIEELLFFISGNTNTKLLESKGVNIWKGNTSKDFMEKKDLKWEEGDMGPSYPFQWRHAGETYQGCNKEYKGIDQLQTTIDNIKKYPFSRRHVISSWDVANIDKMVLPPCHCLFQFYVDTDDENNPKYLDCSVYQRSGDMFLGIPFNIASYSILTVIFAHLTSLTPRNLIYNIGDAHIYKNHVELVKEQIARTPYPFPQLELGDINSLNNITSNYIKFTNYKSWPPLKGDMAI